LALVSIAPWLYLTGLLFDGNHLAQGLMAFALWVAGFQLAMWLARRRCSSESLSVSDGLLYITAYMTVGIGGASMLVAVPCTMFAIVATVGIALISVGDTGPQKAQARFRGLVAWFSKNRMYQ
jgi:hypothetical protein